MKYKTQVYQPTWHNKCWKFLFRWNNTEWLYCEWQNVFYLLT